MTRTASAEDVIARLEVTMRNLRNHLRAARDEVDGHVEARRRLQRELVAAEERARNAEELLAAVRRTAPDAVRRAEMLLDDSQHSLGRRRGVERRPGSFYNTGLEQSDKPIWQV